MRFELGQKIIDTLRGKRKKQKPVVTCENVPNITYTNVKDILQKECIKLHIGCGTVYKEGWINIDNNSDNNIKKLDFMWDLRKPLPLPENSVDFIYNEHFLEHLTADEGGGAFKRMYANVEAKRSFEDCNA